MIIYNLVGALTALLTCLELYILVHYFHNPVMVIVSIIFTPIAMINLGRIMIKKYEKKEENYR